MHAPQNRRSHFLRNKNITDHAGKLRRRREQERLSSVVDSKEVFVRRDDLDVLGADPKLIKRGVAGRIDRIDSALLLGAGEYLSCPRSILGGIIGDSNHSL